MTTSAGHETQNKDDRPGEARGISRLRRLGRLRVTHELFVIVGFCLLTAMMTWPWVLHLRDAVADRGDPYMIAWTLWSDYYQTFHDPLRLFDANVFYPYKYSLAFSENDYGIALLFFPLFAAGMRPLTIHSLATFLGFVFSGYGAFRLTRTLTGGDRGAAWVAGIVFAFIPYRFHLLSHLHYLFAGWIPLMFEALVLFARRSSWPRASWLAVAFLMNALSCISWFIMTLIPLALTILLLLGVHQSLWRNRHFWLRGGLALVIATVALTPFLLPYYLVRVKYGLSWQWWEFAYNSPSLIHWLVADSRNKLWQNFGAHIPGGHKLFPGLMAPLLALAALRIRDVAVRNPEFPIQRWLKTALDAVVLLAVIVVVLALGNGDMTYRVFGYRLIRFGPSVDRAVQVICVALLLRLGMAFPALVRKVRELPNWIKRAHEYWPRTDRLSKEPMGVGLCLTLCGFLSSLGANFFVNRWLHAYLLPFQSIRIPSRAAMVCYLGLAIVAGLGASRLTGRAQIHFASRRVRGIVFALIVVALLYELRAAPLQFEKGEVEPSALALRLEQTPMRGGLVELPSEEAGNRHFYMLRAADHGRPLVNGTSSFISPLTNEINVQTRGPIPVGFIDLLEGIPASYLVVHNDRLTAERRPDYETFLARSLASGRLRFVNSFDGRADLYAVVKNEPEAKSEAPLPFKLSIHSWAAKIDEDPVNMLAGSVAKSQTLYRLYLASSGAMPRYAEFTGDLRIIARDVILGTEGEDQQFQDSLSRFSTEWVGRESFTRSFGGLDNQKYVDRLIQNAGVQVDPAARAALIAALGNGQETRAGVLLQIVKHPAFVEKENDRSLVLLHYFGYLRRNPGDSPDRDLTGFEFWLRDLKRHRSPERLSHVFKDSIEYQSVKKMGAPGVR